jgi:hypothetical protein
MVPRVAEPYRSISPAAFSSHFPLLKIEPQYAAFGGKLKGERHEIRKADVHHWDSVVHSTDHSGSARRAATSCGGLSSLPLDAQASVSAALGRDLPEYQAQAGSGGFKAEKPAA